MSRVAELFEYDCKAMPNSLLDLESVRCFLTASKRGSFRAAAADVHLSPPAFGDRIRRLEEDLGLRLFERTTRKVALTDAGRRFVPEAEHLLETVAACRARLQVDSEQALPFELTLGTRYELGLSWLVPALDKLAQAHPERTLHLYFGDSEDLLRQLQGGRIDALVSSSRLPLTQLDYAPLHDETYVFVGSPKLVAQQDLQGPEQVAELTLIDAHPDLPLFRYFLDAAPPEPAWRFRRVQSMGTIAAVRQRILTGKGVGVLPEYFAKKDLKAGRLIRLMPQQELKQDVFRLIWPTEHRRASQMPALARQLEALPLR